MTRTIRLGTRGSQLALTQSRWVQARLQACHADLAVELVTIKTSGDRFADQPLHLIGGKGLFVKEIEDALTAGTIDCAVHSMKDVPSQLADGLMIAATPEREDPRDVLITREGYRLDTLPSGIRLGTSSLRRMALVRASRADVDVQSLRGNVDTRLRKLDHGDVGAIILAAAGLRRLGVTHDGIQHLDPDHFVPAIGQGVLAIECRCDSTAEVMAGLNHHTTEIAVTAERAFLLRVGGSCRTPLAAHARVSGEALDVRALIASPDGSRVLRGTRRGLVTDAAALGSDLADELLACGGRDILNALGESADGR